MPHPAIQRRLTNLMCNLLFRPLTLEEIQEPALLYLSINLFEKEFSKEITLIKEEGLPSNDQLNAFHIIKCSMKLIADSLRPYASVNDNKTHITTPLLDSCSLDPILKSLKTLLTDNAFKHTAKRMLCCLHNLKGIEAQLNKNEEKALQQYNESSLYLEESDYYFQASNLCHKAIVLSNLGTITLHANHSTYHQQSIEMLSKIVFANHFQSGVAVVYFREATNIKRLQDSNLPYLKKARLLWKSIFPPFVINSQLQGKLISPFFENINERVKQLDAHFVPDMVKEQNYLVIYENTKPAPYLALNEEENSKKDMNIKPIKNKLES